MKKSLIIFGSAMMLAMGAMAQTSVGVRGGVNFTDFRGDAVTGNTRGTGLNFVIPIEKQLSENFAIQPEFHFINKGAKYEITDDSYVKPLTSYLELAVLPKVLIGPEWFQLYLAAGPTVGYGISRTLVTNIDGDVDTDSQDFDDDGDVTDNRLDLGAAFGGGAQLTLGPGKLVVDGRYNLDLNDNVSIDGDEPDGYEKTYNSGIAVTVGYMITLGN